MLMQAGAIALKTLWKVTKPAEAFKGLFWAWLMTSMALNTLLIWLMLGGECRAEIGAVAKKLAQTPPEFRDGSPSD